MNDIVTFFRRRPFLDGVKDHTGRPYLTPAEHEQLRSGDLQLPPDRAELIRAFIRGWTLAKA